MKKTLYLLLFSFILFSFSCNSHKKKTDDEIIINSKFGFIMSNNPILDTSINILLYEGLTRKNENGEIVPGLAEKWEVTSDKKKWTFYLRDNLKYSDGTPLTSKDFLSSWSNGKYSGNSFEDKHSKITAINDRTLTVELISNSEEMEKNFLNSISLPRAAPRKKDFHQFKYRHSNIDISKISSTGPYILKEWSNEKVILEKNPEYWNSNNVNINKITLKHQKNLSSALKDFEKEKIVFTQIEKKEAEKYKNKPELNVIKANYKLFLKFNGKHTKILRNPRVRKALVMAIEKKDGLPENYIQNHIQTFAFNNPFYTDQYSENYTQNYILPTELTSNMPSSVPKYNPEEAKKILLKEIGDINSFPVLEFISYDPHNKDTALKIKKDLEKNLGIKVKLITSYNKKHKKKQPPIALIWFSDHSGTGLFSDIILREKLKILRQNLLDFKKSSNNKEKAEIGLEIDKIIAENIPYMLIDDKIYEYYLINPKIKGLKVGKYGEYILHSPFLKNNN